jgi:hypothetical protein
MYFRLILEGVKVSVQKKKVNQFFSRFTTQVLETQNFAHSEARGFPFWSFSLGSKREEFVWIGTLRLSATDSKGTKNDPHILHLCKTAFGMLVSAELNAELASVSKRGPIQQQRKPPVVLTIP